MWELDYKESWVSKNWCFWTVVLEKTLESPLDCKEIKPVSPKGNQSWIFIRRTGAEAESPILWLPDVKSWLTGKDPEVGKIENFSNLMKDPTDPRSWANPKHGGEGDDRGWEGWMASPTQWTWVWASSGSVACFSPLGLQRVRHDWVTELTDVDHFIS